MDDDIEEMLAEFTNRPKDPVIEIKGSGMLQIWYAQFYHLCGCLGPRQSWYSETAIEKERLRCLTAICPTCKPPEIFKFFKADRLQNMYRQHVPIIYNWDESGSMNCVNLKAQREFAEEFYKEPPIRDFSKLITPIRSLVKEAGDTSLDKAYTFTMTKSRALRKPLNVKIIDYIDILRHDRPANP